VGVWQLFQNSVFDCGKSNVKKAWQEICHLNTNFQKAFPLFQWFWWAFCWFECSNHILFKGLYITKIVPSKIFVTIDQCMDFLVQWPHMNLLCYPTAHGSRIQCLPLSPTWFLCVCSLVEAIRHCESEGGDIMLSSSEMLEMLFIVNSICLPWWLPGGPRPLSMSRIFTEWPEYLKE
jgi:hypothetical protein